MGKLVTMDTICSNFCPWLPCEGLGLINMPLNGDKDSLEWLGTSLMEQRDSQGTVILVKLVFCGVPPTKPHHGY